MASLCGKLELLIISVLTGGLLAFGLATGAVAQGETLLVALTGTESQHFPQLTLYTTVSQAGRPLEKLTAKDFVIFENNLQTPIPPQTVEPVSLTGLQVVLALDISLPETDLAQVKTAAKSLVQTLAMEDRLALLSFGDEVKPNYTFTNNTTALTGAIDALQPEGEHSALYQTIVEAARLLDPLPTGRKAIIIITDSYDNAGSPSLDYTLPWVQKARLPLYIIGFGGKVQGQHPLKDEVVVTGGAYLAVADAGAVNSTMLTLEKQLRQGYKITFNSNLPADNTIHEVFVRVTGPNGDSETAAGQFITTPGPVNLSPTGLTSGQTVSGLVNLGVTATAPAPLSAVTYLLDNQVLAEVTTPPYGFAWDTATTGFGSHVLTIKVVDKAGNTGTIPLNVTVEGSLKVNVFMPPTPIEIGQPVTPTVQIETAAGLASVDYLLNDQLLGRSTAPPYGFGFDTQAYLPGTYQMKVLVTDTNGHTATAVTELELLPAGPPPPTWFELLLQNRWFQLGATMVLVLVALALIIVLTIRLLKLIRQAQQKWVQRRGSLELVNSGNISSRFGLGADAEKNLKFQFSLHGQSLPRLPVAQPAQPVVPAAKAQPASRSKRYQSSVAGVEAVQGRIYGGLSSVIQILTTISQILPGSAGAAVARVTQQISAKYMPVDRLVRTQTQQVRTVEYLRDQVGNVVPKAAGQPAGQVAVGQPFSNGNRPVISEPTVEPVTFAVGAADMWVQTPPVEAGQSLLVELVMTPRVLHRRQTYPFTLTTTPLEQTNVSPLKQSGLVEIKGFFWLWYYLPPVLIVMLMAGLAGLVVTLAVWRLLALNFL